MLAEEFPTLSLALIHKTIAFYLENQAEADLMIEGAHGELERQTVTSPDRPDLAELRRRLAARRALAS
jgi:hypothetical protein